MINPLSTELIPLTQSMQLPADQRTETAPGQGGALEISVHLIPGVADRGVHIADMQLIGSGEHPLRHQMAAADHQFGSAEIDLLDRQRQQGKVLLHMADPPGQLLDRRREHGAALQPAAGASALAIHQRSELGLTIHCREQGIDGLNHLLRSSTGARREPLMNQGNAPGQGIRSRRHRVGTQSIRSLSARCRGGLRSRCWWACPAQLCRSTHSWRRL